MNKIWKIACLCLVVVLLMVVVSAFSGVASAKTPTQEYTNSNEMEIGLANPAAVYCEELGYQYKIITDSEGGQKGVCVFPEKSECDAWEFFVGKCGKEYSYCRKHGYDIETVRNGKSPFSQECAVCVLPTKTKTPVTELMKLDERILKGSIKIKNEAEINVSEIAEEIELNLPSTFDWRNKDGSNWLTPVKNQGGCGSCWAFSAVGIVEPQYNIFYDNPHFDPDLSEQYLVSDCCADCGDCGGGWPATALEFTRYEGITDEACFPYIASNCPCSDRCPDWSNRLWKINYTAGPLPDDVETIKKYLIEKGPLSVCMGIGSKYGGHFDNEIYRCDKDIGANHAVVIVGYNDTGNYWMVKNSWGVGWHEEGYFNVGYKECGIENYIYYASLSKNLSYCPASTNNADYEWIKRVELNGKEKNSGSSTYSNFTDEVLTTLKRGDTYTLYVDGHTTSNYLEFVKVWIDFNDNKDFIDLGEEIDLGNYTFKGNHTFSANFKVPGDAVLSDTRMRVYLKYGGEPEPCENASYGEVEDYTVKIISPAVLTDDYSDYGIDTDRDRYYNYLAIDAGVNVTDSGYYRLSGSLYDELGNYVGYESNYSYLDCGNQSVTLKFSGIRIRKNGVNGTFNLKHLYLEDENYNEVDYRYDAYTTSEYHYTDFEPLPARFASGFHDYGEDTDGDLLYDYLVIEKEVNVSEAGYYRVSGSLHSPSGNYVDSDSNHTTLSAGLHNVTLKFQGWDIYKTEENGNFNVTTYLNYYSMESTAKATITSKKIAVNSQHIQIKKDSGEKEIEFDIHEESQGNRTLEEAGLGSSWIWLDTMENTTSYYNYMEFEPPPADFNDQYSDYGEDTDGNGLYDYLVVNVGVNVTEAGYYSVSGSLCENGTYNEVDYDYNKTYLSKGNQTVQLRFKGFMLRISKYNGTYDLKSLRLYNAGELDYRYYAYTTSWYNWTEFEFPPAEFNDVYSDYGEDTDIPPDGLNNSLVINVGVNVTKSGRYRVRGELYENATRRYVISAYNTTNLNTGNQTVQLRFDGVKLRQNKYNGTYDLKYLSLYNYSYPVPPPLPTPTPTPLSQLEKSKSTEAENISVRYGEQLDYRYYAYTTRYYEWPGWQKPPAEFNDVYSDYGEDTDGNGLYDYLVVNVGVNVTEAGYYSVSGSLCENGTYNEVDYDYNKTYLSEGNQTVQLRFKGFKLRMNEYNGTYDLKWLELYNAGELDYRYYAYTTSWYNWTEFELPPAEFNDVYSDYGEDTDGDGLYDYLVVNVGVNVTEAGYYTVSGELYENGTYNYNWVDYDYNKTYLSEGNQTVQLRFNGFKLRMNEYNGTYDLKWLELYNAEELDYRYYAYTTSPYNWTELQKPPAEFNDVYSDHGLNTTTEDNLYDYLVIEVGVNVTKAGYYTVSGSLYENGTDNQVDYDYNRTYLSKGKQMVQLRFKGFKLRENEYNGTYDLKELRLYNAEKLDYRYYAYTTSWYNWTEFELPPAEFNDVYSDHGEDTDGDGLYDYFVVNVGVNVTEAGNYTVSGELCENGTYNWVGSDYNKTYLSEGNQTVQLRFKGFKIRMNEYNGTYDLKWLELYNAGKLDYRYYAYTTSWYNWTEFELPPAEFNEVYSDYGEDTDGDGLYDCLVVNVGVNVTEAGDYRIKGYLYENGTYDSVDYDSNTTYLNEGNQTVQLRFEGLKIRQNEYNGTYDLKSLYLYNYSHPIPPPTPTPMPISVRVSQRENKSTETESFSVGYREQLDYRYYAYTTTWYNWTEFELPPAEFNDIYSDYGDDTDGDGLYDYLVVNVGVNVTEAGYYSVSGSFCENGTYNEVDYDCNKTYLSEGNQTVQLRFKGFKLRMNEYNGTYDLKWLELYNAGELDYRYYAYTTSWYNWTEFELPPAEFNDIYSDYGDDTDGDGLYDYLVVNVGVNVTEAGDYTVRGSLYENGTYNRVDYDHNKTYLSEGNQTVQLRFKGFKLRMNEYNGTYDLKWLELYNAGELDYRYYAYTTSWYNWTEFELPPAEFNDIYSDYGEDTDGDGLYDYLVINVGVNVTEAGDYTVRGSLYENGTYNRVDYDHNKTYLSEGNQTVQLRFFRIRMSKYNGTYDLKSLRLYNAGGEFVDNKFCAYTTSWYNWTEFEKPPPVSVTRDLPDTAYPGEEIDVSLTQSGFLFNVGKVTEILPEGFEYVSGSLSGDRSDYNKATNNLTIKFKGETTITYKVKAGTVEQIENAVFSGIWRTVDSEMNKINGDVKGDTTLTLGEPTLVFDTGSGTYPSIFGTHNGTIMPNQTITVSMMYTYPCAGTGGHSEYIRIWRNRTDVNASWNGYVGDWHNISFSDSFTLVKGEMYNYTIRTGSYPQIIHKQNHTTLDGSLITCKEFIDAHGNEHDDWIPAFKLFI